VTVWGPGMPKYRREGRPRPRKRSVSSVKRSCDQLWSQIIRAKGECERCGRTPENGRGFHAHHVYGRTDHRLRFDLRNGMAVCSVCHRWAEEHPLEFAKWFEAHRPGDVVYLADQRRLGVMKRTLTDYLELERELKRKAEA
jgi:hypothetical protein